jgi:outer membrane protein assembly factor BamD
MNRVLRVAGLVLGLCVAVGTSPAAAYWVWTPESGKWVNPKYAVKDTANDQVAYATLLYQQKKYKRAIREFRQLIHHFPRSAHASQAQYQIGLCYEAMGRFYQAFESYQKVIDSYPYSEQIEEIIQRQYEIGNLYATGHKEKFLAWSVLPAKDKAVGIYRQVVENAPYGPVADKAQYKLGVVLQELNQFDQAQEVVETLVKNYPNSELVDEARYQLASSAYQRSLEPAYDQGSASVARREFESLAQEFPEAQIGQEAQQAAAILRTREAKKEFDTGQFYERTGRWRSALLYYETVTQQYGDTEWGAKAVARIETIRQRHPQ